MRRLSPTAMTAVGTVIGGSTLAIDCACLWAGWALMPVQIHLYPLGLAFTMITCGVLMGYIHDLFTLARRIESNRRPPPGPRPPLRRPELQAVPDQITPPTRIPRHRRSSS